MSNKNEVQEKVPEPQKVVTAVKRLGDLPRRNITVIVELGDEELHIPCKPLTWKAWQSIGWDVADPLPPIMGADKSNKPIHNYHDPTYRRQLNEAADERTMRRLLAFLDIEIPGETVAEQLAALDESLEAAVTLQLGKFMNTLVSEGEARIEGRAETFHGAGTGGAADL